MKLLYRFKYLAGLLILSPVFFFIGMTYYGKAEANTDYEYLTRALSFEGEVDFPGLKGKDEGNNFFRLDMYSGGNCQKDVDGYTHNLSEANRHCYKNKKKPAQGYFKTIVRDGFAEALPGGDIFQIKDPAYKGDSDNHVLEFLRFGLSEELNKLVDRNKVYQGRVEVFMPGYRNELDFDQESWYGFSFNVQDIEIIKTRLDPNNRRSAPPAIISQFHTRNEKKAYYFLNYNASTDQVFLNFQHNIHCYSDVNFKYYSATQYGKDPNKVDHPLDGHPCKEDAKIVQQISEKEDRGTVYSPGKTYRFPHYILVFENPKKPFNGHGYVFKDRKGRNWKVTSKFLKFKQIPIELNTWYHVSGYMKGSYPKKSTNDRTVRGIVKSKVRKAGDKAWTPLNVALSTGEVTPYEQANTFSHERYFDRSTWKFNPNKPGANNWKFGWYGRAKPGTQGRIQFDDLSHTEDYSKFPSIYK